MTWLPFLLINTHGTSTETTDDDAATITERSLAHLKKRVDSAGAVCNNLTLECQSRYESTTESCSDGYEVEPFAIEGFASNVWCTKKCTKEESTTCQDQECPEAKNAYGLAGRADDCYDAVFRCAGSPVEMDESRCTTKKLGDFGNWCDNNNHQCVVYRDGACQSNATLLETISKNLETGFKGADRLVEKGKVADAKLAESTG